jgi:hypothetical protein
MHTGSGTFDSDSESEVTAAAYSIVCTVPNVAVFRLFRGKGLGRTDISVNCKKM